MSIASEITRIKTNISNAYTQAQNKGATMPQTQNSANLANTIASITGGSSPINQTYSQINPLVTEYLSNANYSADDYSVSVVSDYYNQQVDYRKDEPSGVTVSTGSGSAKLSNENEYKSITETVQSGNNTFYNLIPSDSSYLSVENNGNIVNFGKLTPIGALRMIYAPSIRNVRDLGGWNCDGGTVKYGKIYRGSELDNDVTISVDDISRLKNQCGIKVDLDLRGNSTITENSPLGNDVTYTHINASYYKNAIDLEKAGKDYLRTAQIIQTIFDNIKNKKPVYFHCQQGKDRTGTIAGLILGILGVAQTDCDKDYELTSFAIQNDAQAYASRALVNSSNPALSWKAMMEYLATMDGDTFAEKICSWMIVAGISLSDINEFRRNMSSGTPTDLTNKVDYSCKSISLNKATLTILEGTTDTVSASISPIWCTDSLSVSSSDTSKATVSLNGNTAIIRGVSEGNATITFSCGNRNATVSVIIQAETKQYVNVTPTIKDGVQLSSSDHVTETSNQAYFCSEYGDITNYDVDYRLINEFTASHTLNAEFVLYFYDENYDFISATSKLKYPNTLLEGTKPSNAKYFKIRGYHSGTADDMSAYASNSIVKFKEL